MIGTIHPSLTLTASDALSALSTVTGVIVESWYDVEIALSVVGDDFVQGSDTVRWADIGDALIEAAR
jgi:hypothetical protein